MTAATLGLILGQIFAGDISQWLFGTTDRADLVRASFVGLWAQMNYGQLTSLFRVEQRSTSYVIASVANVLITIGSTIVLVVGFHEGALGVIVGNFLGTLTVYLGLLAYRREQLGLQFDWELFKRMEHFGLPLLPPRSRCGRSTSPTASSSRVSRAPPRRASTRSGCRWPR